ncbi:MAG: virulence RhuM family protein [Candidatus Gracilibacteria bacterium]
MSSVPQIFSNFVIFQTTTGKINIDVYFQDETLWLTQKNMAELFEVNVPAISKHLDNIYGEGELIKEATVSILEIVQDEGGRRVKRKVEYYNLHAILAVGYRVNSGRAIEFRKWASTILEEYIIKGFAMDDERLKQMKHFGKDYFDEMLERIREIRVSERRLYQKITDIYALSADYDTESDITKHFFASVQNKLHWAITGKTAAEIIYSEADSTKAFMGLKTWKQAPKGKILKSDVIVAKNYLSEEHIKTLNALVNSYLDLAESRATNRKVMNMKDWDSYLQQFLELAGHPILDHVGTISMLEAKLKAENESEQYRVIQDRLYESDFDRLVQNMNLLK